MIDKTYIIIGTVVIMSLLGIDLIIEIAKHIKKKNEVSGVVKAYGDNPEYYSNNTFNDSGLYGSDSSITNNQFSVPVVPNAGSNENDFPTPEQIYQSSMKVSNNNNFNNGLDNNAYIPDMKDIPANNNLNMNNGFSLENQPQIIEENKTQNIDLNLDNNTSDNNIDDGFY